MRISTLTVFLLSYLCNAHLSAQGFSFESDFPTNEIIPVEGNGFLLASSQIAPIDSVLLVYWDSNAQPKSTITISLKRELGELNLEDIFVWNNKVIVLKSLFYSGQQRNRLLLYEYSLPDLELINSEQLAEAHNPFDLRLPFHYNLSPDSSKLLITSWSFFASDSLAQMELRIFDSEWKVLENRQHKLSYKNEKISVYGCKIDDESNCYILGDVYSGENINYINPREVTNFIIASFQGANQIHTYEMKIHEITVDDWYFELDQQQNLVAVGLFKERVKTLVAGLIFFRIDRRVKGMQKFLQKIDKELFITAFESNGLGFKTPKNRFISYTLSNAIFKEDAYYLIAENFNFTIDGLKDILVISIGLDGELKWLKRLPKIQKLEFGINAFASFATVEQEEDLLFFYNGNAENFGNDHSDKIKAATSKNATLCVTKINLDTQKITRQNLNEVFPKGYLTTPRFCKKITADKVVIMANGIYNNLQPLTKFKIQILKVEK